MTRRTYSFLTLLFVFFFVTLSSLAAAVSTDYAYSKLNKEEKAFYRQLDETIGKEEEVVKHVSLSKEDALKVYSAYLDDHPGVFWLTNGISYQTEKRGDEIVGTNVLLTYTHESSLAQDKRQFETIMAQYHEMLKKEKNAYNKLLMIYDHLATTVTYNTNYMDQTLWSVFFNRVGVCAGFARSFQYLALQEGIPCIVVTGYQKDEKGKKSETGHMWCMAKVKGKWYHFDPTWGLAVGDQNVQYAFFCRSEKVIKRTHVIDNPYKIPSASSDKLSYSNQKGRYFEKFDEEDAIKAIEKALDKGETSLLLEFGSKKQLDKAVKALVKEGGLSPIATKLGKRSLNYQYGVDERNWILTLSF